MKIWTPPSVYKPRKMFMPRNDLEYLPWARPYLPGGPSWNDFAEYNGRINEIYQQFGTPGNRFLAMCPENQDGIDPECQIRDRAGNLISCVVVWECLRGGPGVDNPIAIKHFSWTCPSTGKPKPLNGEIIFHALDYTTRALYNKEEAKKLIRAEDEAHKPVSSEQYREDAKDYIVKASKKKKYSFSDKKVSSL